MPLDKSIKKTLVIGSGPIVIGQAAEFDYAGAQACRVLKEAGINVVLVNSNPATIMTDKALADEIYLEPLTVETVKRIIEKEKPDSLLAGLGGQTGLTIAMQLAKEGFLEKSGVRLLGTSAEAIDKAEDRQLFRETMLKIGQPCIPSDIAHTIDEALLVAEKIGYPIIVRPAFTLGGAGGGVANNPEELRARAENGLSLSPITQVLIEKYIYGWKEVEFEVMRDGAGNVLSICSMENFDPVGVHTGDSIVVAPALTLATKELQILRNAALDIISELKIAGGCNCQFALDPVSLNYSVIEVNPRVSRSSALASKATGYPIAKVTTQIAIGYTLDEIKNEVTGKTSVCFEPALDYVVVKMPKWPFDKFFGAPRTLGTAMKATGEVMAIAPNFEMALMKAVRGAEISLDTLTLPKMQECEDIVQKLHDMDDERVFAVYEALKRGVEGEKIHDITKIDLWFIEKLNNLAMKEKKLSELEVLDEESYKEAKNLGFTDSVIEQLSGCKVESPASAVYKMVDTCAAEFSAETPYFYSSFDKACDAKDFINNKEKETILVLGAGPIRIGQGIEFDYSSVHCVWALQDLGYEVVIINNNPETVSTDFDTADRLYFEPLTPEDVMHIINIEKPIGVVVAFGGQTAIKLTKFLDSQGIEILGTSADSIDLAEDRGRFDKLLSKFNIKSPEARAVFTLEDAIKAAEELGYPVLLRPSYVIGGQNMTISYNKTDTMRYMEHILEEEIENPVLIDKYMMGVELEVDVISDGKDVLIPGIMQHVERAGVHSGDSIAVYPPYSISDKMLERISDCSVKLALSLGTKGLVNIQYVIYHNELYVIEVNPRASRTIPYISKVTGVPMVELAAKVMVGLSLESLGYDTGIYKQPPYFAVKVPVFSFEKLSDVNTKLGPEMKSTGEVLGIGRTLVEAMFKGLVAAGFKIPEVQKRHENGVFITVNDSDKFEIVNIAKKFADMGLKLYATRSTADTIRAMDLEVTTVQKANQSDELFKLLDEGRINFIVYTGYTDEHSVADYIKLSRKAIQKSVATLTSLDTADALAEILLSRFTLNNTELVNINDLREEKQKLPFFKMVGTGNDYIFFENFDSSITCPESLSVIVSDRNYGIGGHGIVLIEHSDVADVKMRTFNSDGSEGKMAGNSIRCVGKYVYDRGISKKEEITIETASGVRKLRLYIYNSKVRSALVDMGKAELHPKKVPCLLDGDKVINRKVKIGDKDYNITAVSMGNPHCVVFCDHVDSVDLETLGPVFENSPIFPQRVNAEFVRIVNPATIKMRVWERGNGETLACGTGACAAVVAAVENGYCSKGEDITVKLPGGDLIVNYTDEGVYLTGNADLAFEGVVEY